MVSFNVEEGRDIEGALETLRADPTLADADVVLLQEMDEDGTRRMAEALGMGFVYFPAIRFHRTGRDFGNAILSRWPLSDSKKIILPHRSVFGRTQRIATVATLQVGRTPVRVYSVHLATPVNMALRDRRDQFGAVLSDASRHPHVIIGGDLNSGGLGRMAEDRGYVWPTREGPRTLAFGRWDHVLFKGFELPDSAASGTLEDVGDASDHRPVWAVGIVR